MRSLVWLAAALPAAVPPTLPTRDVAVAYQVEGAAVDAVPGGIGGLLHLSWDAKGQRLRVESDGRPQALLVDLPGRSAQLVDRGFRTAVTLPVRERDLQPLMLEPGQLTRRGQAVVAGLGCAEYAVRSPRGSGTVCLTPDGVALRAAGEVDGKAGRFTAVSVQYGTQPASLFQAPAGYFQFALPGGRTR